MALTYANFQAYPIQIVGINSEYNSKISEIETFVTSDIAYSGDAGDITAILPFFVYYYLCDDNTGVVTANAGEAGQVKEFSDFQRVKINNAWNLGVDKMRVLFGITDEILDNMFNIRSHEKIHRLVEASEHIVNEKYLSKRSGL